MSPKTTLYKIDLRELKTDGNFPCPECGIAISPDDVTDTIYEISGITTEEEMLAKVTVTCKKCGSKIDLIGFLYKPPPKEEIAQKFSKLKPLYKQLIAEVEFIIIKHLKKRDIKIHSMTGRVKSFDSFYKKIIRREIVEDPFTAINDIAAIRIICLYRKDLERIGNIITKEFDVISSDTSRTRSEEHFGYMSDHYLISLPEKCKGPRYDEVKHLECEIQVRTILMHAWASVSHHLDYKQEIDIPSNLRKDLKALSGLFYVADTHFEMFRESIEQTKLRLIESMRKKKLDPDQEIDLDSLRAYLQWKLPNRKKGRLDSALLNDVIKKGYSKLIDIEKRLSKRKHMIEKCEKEAFGEPHFTQEDFLRMSLDIMKFRKR